MTVDQTRAQAIADVIAAIRAAAQADHRDGYNIKPRTIDPATGAALAWDRAIRAADGVR